MRFDWINLNNHNAQLAVNKLAKFREVINKFTTNCRKNVIPSDPIAVDDMLEKLCDWCAFKQFIKSKPQKYDIKISAFDVKTSYT